MSIAPIESRGLRLVAQAPERLRTLVAGAEIYGRRFGFGLADGAKDFF